MRDYHGWFSSSVKEPVILHADTVSNFSLTCWLLGGRRLCYPPRPCRAICCYGARRLNRQPSCICLLLPFIRISWVASARYRRCSLSHDIVAMCAWRSISRYRLIDIIPSRDLVKIVCGSFLLTKSYLFIDHRQVICYKLYCVVCECYCGCCELNLFAVVYCKFVVI